MLLYYLCVAALIFIVVYRYKKRKMYILAAKITSFENELPIIGVGHTLMGNPEDILTVLQYYSYCAMKDNGIFKAWLYNILYISISNPVDLEYLLKTCLEKDDLYRFLRKLTGYGIVFAPVAEWRRRRRVMLPAFSPKIVETFISTFSVQSQTLVNKLEKYMQKKSTSKFDIWPFLNSYSFDSIFHTAMGINIDAQNNPNSPLLIAMNRVLKLISERIVYPWLQLDWLYKLYPKSRIHDSDIKTLHGFVEETIRKRREELKIENERKTDSDIQYDLGIYKQRPFLDILIENSAKHNGYTDVELRDEILTSTIAGTDSSSVATGYTLMMLAKYPDIQERAYQEVHTICGESDRLLEKDDLMQLKYLERVVKETLRLFPPVPFIIRKVDEEITLPSGYKLPAGSGVVISIWGMHRDPKYWGPDAEVFDPDRFLPQRFTLEHPCSYMPFSQGPRNCVGFQYAMMSLKITIANILRKFKIVADPELSAVPYIRSEVNVMMKAVDGFQIGLERRSYTGL